MLNCDYGQLGELQHCITEIAELDCVKSVKGLKIIHLNVRSLLKHLEEIEHDLLDGCLDVIILSETWLHGNVSNSLFLNEKYKLIRLDRKVRKPNGSYKTGGGLCVFVRNDISYVETEVVMLSDEDVELIHVKLTHGHMKPVNLTAVYRPPSGNLQNAVEKIEQCLTDNRYGNSLVMGDFNVDLNKNTCSSTRSLISFAARNSMRQLIANPTRITHNSSSTIDLVFSNLGYISHAAPVNYNISDHLPIILVKKKARLKKTFSEIYCRSYKDLDHQKFILDIQAINFGRIYELSCPSKMWDSFYEALIEIVDKHCPYKTIRIYEHRLDFISTELADLMHSRDCKYKTARLTNTPEDWAQARALRNQVCSELIIAKRDYINSQIDTARGDSKKFWRIINDNFFRVKSPKIDQVFRNHSDELLSGKPAADEVNNYFCNISTELSAKFDPLHWFSMIIMITL